MLAASPLVEKLQGSGVFMSVQDKQPGDAGDVQERRHRAQQRRAIPTVDKRKILARQHRGDFLVDVIDRCDERVLVEQALAARTHAAGRRDPDLDVPTAA
jgi:hypothetical protein